MLFNKLQEGIFILYENEEWIKPYKEALQERQVPFQALNLNSGAIDLSKTLPKGVYFSKMSASSHTRGNTLSKEYARAFFSLLQTYNLRLINNLNVLELEVSKVAQYNALNSFGFHTPKTFAIFGKEELLRVAKNLATPFISKHNQGGKGLGVRRFESLKEFESYIHSDEFEEPIDGITLLQEYIVSKESFITRLEFIGGKFFYAVRVDTSDGAFKLCPADSCEIERKALPKLAGAACDIGAKFTLNQEITAKTPLVRKLESFLKQQKIEIAGIEFITTPKDELVIYDINTNTNYNKSLEENLIKQGKQSATQRVVSFLCDELQKIKEEK